MSRKKLPEVVYAFVWAGHCWAVYDHWPGAAGLELIPKSLGFRQEDSDRLSQLVLQWYRPPATDRPHAHGDLVAAWGSSAGGGTEGGACLYVYQLLPLPREAGAPLREMTAEEILEREA